jgi:adenosylcobinamide-phosphate synthase
MTILENRILCLAAAFLLDNLLGDPYCLPHPVRFIGRLIGFFDGDFRKESDSPGTKRKKGLLLVIFLLAICGGVTFIGLYIVYHIHRAAGIVVESILCYQMLSMKSLKTESMKVYRALEKGETEQARIAVSMIVGRDTDRLDEDGIIRAAVETVAENTSDGVIAPMFYLAIGGGLFGVLYKTINTMDSMVGYKNEKYLDFGRYAAKLDDLANFIPSRMAALLMIAGTGVCRLAEDVRMLYRSLLCSCLSGNGRYKRSGRCQMSDRDSSAENHIAKNENRKMTYNPGNALRIYRRDCRNHASPNSAQTESVCAGALGIRLAGDAWYFGKKVEKPYIGDNLRHIEAEDIRRANVLLYVTSFLMWGICLGVCAILRLVIL